MYISLKFLLFILIFSFSLQTESLAMIGNDDEEEKTKLSTHQKLRQVDEKNNFGEEKTIPVALRPLSCLLLTENEEASRNEANMGYELEFIETNDGNTHLNPIHLIEDPSLITSDTITSPSQPVEIKACERDMVKDLILSYIEKYLINEQEIPEDKKRKAIRKFFQFLTPPLLGVMAGLPLLEPACQAAQGNLVLCPVLSGGTFIAIGGPASWAGFRLTSQLDPISSEEINILHSSKRHRLAKYIISNAISIISSIPDVFAAYKFNTVKWFAIPAFFVSVAFKSQGYYEFLSFLPTLWQQPLSSKQELISSAVAQNIDKQIILKLLEDNTTSIDEIKIVMKEKLHQLLALDSADGLMFDDLDNPHKWKNGYPRKGVQFLSLIFPIGNAVISALLAYEALELISSSPFLCFPGTIIAVIPGFSLEAMATTSIIGEIFDITYNKIKKRESKKLFSILYPTSSKIVPLVSFIISACGAITNSYIITYGTVSNSVFSSLKYVLPVMAFVENTIFGTYTSSIVGQEFIKKITVWWGSVQERTLIFMIKKIETIKEFMSHYFTYENQYSMTTH